MNGGYTNVSAFANALNTISADQCETPSGTIVAGCVPIDLFSTGFGSITSEMHAANSATGILKSEYEQNVVSAVAFGPLDALLSPMAETPVYVSIGAEYREEIGSIIPDECLKEPPSSCLGGAGGNVLPISSEYDVTEIFGEAFIPLVEGADFAKDLEIELGFRVSDYSTFGNFDTWKAGLNWEIVDGLRFRGMLQRAVRAPNISELGSPITTGLSDADFDPCSNGNPNPISDTLVDRCVSTGVLEALVGVVPDIVSGQINAFSGTDPLSLPEPETADTMTVGMSWQTPVFANMTSGLLTLDYYDIDITDVIGEFTAQEVLNNCYTLGDATECAKINRIGSSLGTTGAGVNLFTTNLDYFRASGIDLGVQTDWDLEQYGELSVSLLATLQTKNESQSSSSTPVTDCLGVFGNDCQPTPELRFNQRTTWKQGPYTASLLWRYFGEVDVQETQRDATFDGFETISQQHRFDVSGSYDVTEALKLTVNIRNVFDEDPPIVGNQAGSTARNFGNTFPSAYETLGRLWTIGASATF